MPHLLSLIHIGVMSAAITGLVYAVTVTVTALTAVFAHKHTRRNVAQQVLKTLLRTRSQDSANDTQSARPAQSNDEPQ